MDSTTIGPVTLKRHLAGKGDPLLSVLVASVAERNTSLMTLIGHFTRQLANSQDAVELLVAIDRKEISIGAKRQLLLEHARGEWIVFFDDDDLPYPHYLSAIAGAIRSNPAADCVGFPIDMTTNGQNPQRCCHSFRYKQWERQVDGWDYVRTITHFNPVRRAAALQAGFKDMRFGEDHDYSLRVMRHLRCEVYLPQSVFHYQYSDRQPHQDKYGIR